MVGKKHVFVAVVLVAMAMIAIAQAQILLGTVTVTTAEAVKSPTITAKFPARSAGKRIYKTSENNITLTLTTANGFADGDDVRVAVELVVNDPAIFEGFKSLVIEVVNSTGTAVATLTKNTPYAEFVQSNITPGGTYTYAIRIIFATGPKTLTNVAFRLSATIIGFS